MAGNFHRLEVLLASPSDVREHFEKVEKEIHDWNARRTDTVGVFFQARRWERDVNPAHRGPPQHVINEDLVETVECAIVLFWGRIGQPTQSFESGTIEEIHRVRARGVHPLILDCQLPQPKTLIDTKQLDRLQHALSELRASGFVHTYASDERLAELVSRYLDASAKNATSGGGANSHKAGVDPRAATPQELVEARSKIRSIRRQLLLAADSHSNTLSSLIDAGPVRGSEFDFLLQRFQDVACQLPEDAYARCERDIRLINQARTFAMGRDGRSTVTKDEFAVRWTPVVCEHIREIEAALERQWLVTVSNVPSLKSIASGG